MGKKEDIKKIERRARSMLLSKDIPAHKQEVVRALINNAQLKPEEKWRAVIELVQNCADKKVVFYEERAPREAKKRPHEKRGGPQPSPETSAPTETSYYIDKMHRKFRSLKLFRIRTMVHRDNRIGIGFRRRLIPAKRFLKLMDLLAQAQFLILSRIDAVMMEILNDPAVEEPGAFNYLRLIRKWMSEVPLAGETYNSIKWMERNHFDHIFRGYVSNFYSFLKLDNGIRERILFETENRLRSVIDIKRDGENADVTGAPLKGNEKQNPEKENQIYEYMMTLRSFLPADPEIECLLSKQVFAEFSVSNLSEFLRVTEEALVFQRPIKIEEIVSHYHIEAPIVAANAWDCSDELLKRAGKDPESLKRKRRESLTKQLEPYETRAMLLKHEVEGQNLLLKAYADQLRYINRKQQDPKAAYNENFFNFLYGLVLYFKNSYVPLLDGSAIVFRDMGREEHAGSLFSVAYFAGLLDEFKSVVDDMGSFRSENPGAAVSRDEVKKMLRVVPDAPFEAGALLRSAGECFYKIGRELQLWYDSHRRWALSHAKFSETELIRVTIKERDLSAHDEEDRPIPYHDCVIKDIAEGSALVNELIGKRVLEDSLRDGVYVRMNAFAYQVAYECLNDRLLLDIEEMKALRKSIEQG